MKKNIQVKAIEKARRENGSFIEGTNSFGNQWCVVKVIDGAGEAYQVFDYKLPQDLVSLVNQGYQPHCEIDYTYNEKFKKNELKNISVIKEVPNVPPKQENPAISQLEAKINALELRVKNLETKIDFNR